MNIPSPSRIELLAPILVAWACLLVLFIPATAAEPGAKAEPKVAASAEWPLERIVLTDGKSYQGLIETEGAASIEFVEVRRPRGKPMFLVVRPVDLKNIATWERLKPEEKEKLRARLEKHKQRARVDARRMEDLQLSPMRNDGKLVWQYRGSWFSLDSTADEAMTRRSIVRLEQIFTAYRQVLPPRRVDARRLTIRMFGDNQHYHAALSELGLEIKNPAVYLADRNLILAGGDMNRFDAELAQINRQHRQVKQQFDALVAEMPARIKALGDDLKKNEIPPAERQKILVAEQKKAEEQRKAARRKILALDRKNSAKFTEVSGQMFTRLAHEAFHAYLETYVYPRQEYDVPRWLNEGLAQVFEAGLLEADTLRIDTPNLPALEKLRTDLRRDDPLQLADLLNAGSEAFLSGHASDGQLASRSYYYSWGLAYYLAFDQGIIGTTRFNAYLSPAEAKKPPVERFEALVGAKLDDFQARWSAAMLKLDTAALQTAQQASTGRE